MVEYPGAAWAGVSPNRSARAGTVKLFIVHHWAGTGDAIAQRNVFMGANSRDVSPNYQVNADGSVFEIVPPDRFRAWTTGTIDHQAVTCETQNISGAPNWGISAASHEAIAQLVAWAAARYGFPIQRGAVVSGNVVTRPGVVGHRETPAGRETSTACPGPSMDLDYIVARAAQIAAGIPLNPIDHARLRRQKEETMYVRGASNPEIYATSTDANGNLRVRLAKKAEAAYAGAGGLVIFGDDATLTMLGIEGQYMKPYSPTVDAKIDFTPAQLAEIASHIEPGMTADEVKAAVAEGMQAVVGAIGFSPKS